MTIQAALDSRSTASYRPAVSPPHTDSILIVDFGSQVTQLIARRVREARYPPAGS